MHYEKDTWYWIHCDSGGWVAALFNVDGQFVIGGRFVNPDVFEGIEIVEV